MNARYLVGVILKGTLPRRSLNQNQRKTEALQADKRSTGETYLESALSSTSLIRVPNRGSYTHFSPIVAAHPGATNLTIDRIGDLLGYKLSDLLGTTSKGKRT